MWLLLVEHLYRHVGEHSQSQGHLRESSGHDPEPVRTAVRVGEGREGNQGQEPGAPKESRPGNQNTQGRAVGGREAQPLDWRAQGRGATRRTQ